MTPLAAYLALLAVLAVERGIELLFSARNARRLRARGAVEAGHRHYPPMVAMHALFLVACAVEAFAAPSPPPLAVAVPALLALALAQGIRWWAIATLGGRWTTIVVALPAEAPVTSGPYRLVRHPNYVAVALEIAAAPLAYGSWRTAVVFSAANAVVLWFRVRAEEGALGAAWAAAFRDRPRFVPRRRRDVA